MLEWIHADQTGFIPGREGKDNCIITLLLLQKGKSGKSPAIRLSIDAEKAFDRMGWRFMMDTIENLGIGPKMAKWIKNLYNHPTASVKVNGNISAPFEMFNGTRQGCPLPPLCTIARIIAGNRTEQHKCGWGEEGKRTQGRGICGRYPVLYFQPQNNTPKLIKRFDEIRGTLQCKK